MLYAVRLSFVFLCFVARDKMMLRKLVLPVFSLLCLMLIVPDATAVVLAVEVSTAEAETDGHDHGAGASDPHDGDDHHSGGDHGAAGPPMEFKADLALWSLIVFVIFLFVLKKVAWGPMIEGLDKREAGIRAAIAEAEENQRKSQALMAEYEEKLRGAEQTVADMVAEAKRDAERTSQDIVAKAEADVTALRDRATGDIAQAKDAALADVFTSVNAQVGAATERVLGRALSDDDQERLIQEALAEISG